RKFVVTVSASRKDTLGKLEIVAEGTTASREVKGLNCGEVVSALALFTALAIDPNASATVASHDDNATPPVTPSPITVAPPLLKSSEVDTGRGEGIPPKQDATHPGAKLLFGGHGVVQGGFSGGSAVPTISPGGGVFLHVATAGFGSYRLSGAYFAESSTN